MSVVPSEIFPVPGVQLGTARAGIKKPNRRDLVLIKVPEGAHCVAAFTQNRFCAAPVSVAKAHLAQGEPQWLLINTGYANAGLGEQGMSAALACCQAVAQLLNTQASAVLPFSTGVIGEPLPVDRIAAGLPSCQASLSDGAEAWQAAAEGIMTTDTRPKLVSVCTPDQVIVTGMAKGAGMICPNMATMLGFIAVNQSLDKALAQRWIQSLVAGSFNAITVDGDTSTNDAVVLICHGEQDLAPIVDDSDPRAQSVYAALEHVFVSLAQAIVRDAEGATKFVTITVSGAQSQADCESIARVVAHSPLVKTALYASDPNWGRILAAVGRAPVAQFSIEAVSMQLNGHPFVVNGRRIENYDEATMATQMQCTDLNIDIQVGDTPHRARVWTSDLSSEYVKINAEYRS